MLRLAKSSVLLILVLFCHLSMANPAGSLFKITEGAGTVINNGLSITLCINGKVPLSCQNYTVSNTNFTVTAIAPNVVYPIAGIRINSSQYSLTGGGSTPQANGFSLFQVSSTSGSSLVVHNNSYYTVGGTITGLIGSITLQNNGADYLTTTTNGQFTFKTSLTSGAAYNVTVRIMPVGQTCIVSNATGTVQQANVNNVVVTCQKRHIVFLSQTLTKGDMSSGGGTGIVSADALCTQDALTYGTTLVKSHATYKALLLSDTRYPCSSPDNGITTGCGASFAVDWPIVANTPYYDANGTLYVTANANAVFPGLTTDLVNPAGGSWGIIVFWMGIQSVLGNNPGGTPLDIIGWAYTNMNPAESSDYNSSLANCNNWSDQTAGQQGANGENTQAFINNNYPFQNPTWGNYYQNQNDSNKFMLNNWSISNTGGCDGGFPIVCVSSDG